MHAARQSDMHFFYKFSQANAFFVIPPRIYKVWKQ